jgi:hypothetical protein
MSILEIEECLELLLKSNKRKEGISHGRVNSTAMLGQQGSKLMVTMVANKLEKEVENEKISCPNTDYDKRDC